MCLCILGMRAERRQLLDVIRQRLVMKDRAVNQDEMAVLLMWWVDSDNMFMEVCWFMSHLLAQA